MKAMATVPEVVANPFDVVDLPPNPDADVMAAVPLGLFERELTTLRKNVEKELLSGFSLLRDGLHKSVVEALRGLPEGKSEGPGSLAQGCFFQDRRPDAILAQVNLPNAPDHGSASLITQPFGTSNGTGDISGIPTMEVEDANWETTMSLQDVPDHLLNVGRRVRPIFLQKISTPSKPEIQKTGSDVYEQRNDGNQDAVQPASPPRKSVGMFGMPDAVNHLTKHLSSKVSRMSESNPDKIQLENKDTISYRIKECVRNDWFDYGMSLILILNSLVVGLRVDWEASHIGSRALVSYIWLDRVFCICFVAELLMRLYTFRLAFYTMNGWQWAYFDTTIVVIQVFEEIMVISAGQEADSDFGFLKLLKMGRLLRMCRMVRLLPELKSLGMLIIASMSSFFWTCILMLLLVYMLAIYLVMMAVDSLGETTDQTTYEVLQVKKCWGSVGSAILTLYYSITGGVDWADVIEPLVAETGSQVHTVVFCCFVAFATMVLMNLVTGVFVEGAARLSKEDRARELSKMAYKVFRLFDDDCSDDISKEEFEKHLAEGLLDPYLNAVELPRSAAINLFEILDVDHSGSICVSEFAEGCLKLRLQPRTVDIAQILHETHQLAASQTEWFIHMCRMFDRCHREVRKLGNHEEKQSQAPKRSETVSSVAS